jgi:NAD-dependent DNA ligase
MLGTIIGILAITLSLEYYFKERKEKEEKLYAELVAKDNAVNNFISEFGIDRRRAEILYKEGFKKLEDFKEMSIEELMQIDDINPTVAKRIESRMKNF